MILDGIGPLLVTRLLCRQMTKEAEIFWNPLISRDIAQELTQHHQFFRAIIGSLMLFTDSQGKKNCRGGQRDKQGCQNKAPR